MAGIAWEFETFPEYLDAVGRRGNGPQLHGVHRALRAAALRDGRRRLRARRDGGRDRADVRARARGDRQRARPGSRPASRSRTAASTASRCRAASPSTTRSRRCSSPRARPARAWCSSRPGEQCSYADVYEWQPRVGRPFTYPLFASPGGQAPRSRSRCTSRASRAARACGRRSRRDRSPCSSRWPTPTASTPGKVFGELMKVSRAVRLAAYRDPDVAGARGGRPRGVADEAAVGDLRGVGVAAVPRAAGPAGERPRARARLQPARRDVRDRGRRRPHDPLPCVHRQRRRRGRRPAAHARERRARPLRRGRARRPAVRRAAADRPARHLGARPRGHAARGRGPQADRRAGRHVRLRAPRLSARGLLGRRVRVRSADASAPARPGACATSRPTPSA